MNKPQGLLSEFSELGDGRATHDKDADQESEQLSTCSHFSAFVVNATSQQLIVSLTEERSLWQRAFNMGTGTREQRVLFIAIDRSAAGASATADQPIGSTHKQQ